jgi:hypothetical protein
MSETSGFYKYQDGQLFHGPNYVESKAYSLHRENRENLSLPVDGWHWFDSREEALAYFGIADPEGTR